MNNKKGNSLLNSLRDLAGTRTQDPYIKSVLLYQLSYQILPFFKLECENKAKTFCTKVF